MAVGGEEKRTVALGGNHGNQPLRFFLGTRREDYFYRGFRYVYTKGWARYDASCDATEQHHEKGDRPYATRHQKECSSYGEECTQWTTLRHVKKSCSW